LITYYLLFFKELATRQGHLAALTAHPDEDWVLQVSRNVTDPEDGFLCRTRFLLMDRDAKFSEVFQITLKASGVEPVQLPLRSPNLSPHVGRFMRAWKRNVWSASSSWKKNLSCQPRSVSWTIIMRSAPGKGSETG
jgi:hypothetical protein